MVCSVQFWAYNRDRWTSNAHSVKQYATCIRDRLVDEYNLTSVQLYFDVWCSLNGRFQQRSRLTRSLTYFDAVCCDDAQEIMFDFTADLSGTGNRSVLS